MSTNNKPKTLRTIRLMLPALLLGVVLLGVLVSPSAAANPAPVAVFHLTEPEDDMLDAMNVINSVANSPMVTKISIAISANGTLVYYDHWEDGFADDIANPTPSEIYSAGNLDGVQIWGNSLATDGCAPQIGNTPVTCTNANDVLNKGNVIILDDSSIVVPNLASTIDWDGKDKVGASNAVAVTRSLWASDSNSLFAWANAMYPTTEWGQEYTTPVGCDTISATADMFEYAAFTITAAYDGTVIQTDPEGDGTWEANVTLNEGQTYFESSSTGGTCSYVKQGGKVRSTDPAKPIQVVLVTGDIAGSPGYGSRDLNLAPDAQLSSSYWMPVGNSTGQDGSEPGDVRLYIYNPQATTMYVRCEKPSTSTVLTIAADTVNSSFTLLNDQAGHCFAVTGPSSTTPDTSRKFTGLATVDADGTIWDWGVPFVPEDRLSNQALVGLGAGRDWTSGTNPNQNGSPLWVTPICQTFFYVDWDNNGTPDKVDFNGDNDVTDTNVNGLDETTSDDGFQVSLLQSARLFDASDRDQTGAYIYTKTAANNGGTGGCNFAAAWGEDPRVASAASPGLDLGTIIVALRAVETSKDSVLLTDADSSGTLTPGDTLRYVITVENTGLAPVSVSVEDTIPTNTTYVANSTQKDVGSGWVAIPDSSGFPLDSGGVSLGSLPVGDTWQVRFSVTINSLPAGQTIDITNCAEISYDSSLVETCKVNTVTVPAAPALTLDKTTTTAYYNAAGNTISYSYKLTNSGNVPLIPPYAVSDNKATVTCPQTPNPLAIGAFITCTATYTVVTGDVTAGQVVNVATATAQYNSNPVTSNQDTVTVPYAGLNVVKSSTTTVITAAGQVVPYTFTVTNTGNVALTGVTVVDPKCTSAISGPTGDTNSNSKLDLTETWVYSCTHTVTLAEMNAGGNLANTVTADSNETGPDTDPLNIPIQQNPALTLDKTTTTPNYDSVGDTISYNYTVTNSGNVSLIPPYAVSDNKITTPNTVTCNQTPNPLNPGASFTCTATYTVVAGDVTAGQVVNIATATAKHGATTVTSNQDSVTVPLAALNVDKTSTTTLITAVGQVVPYTFTVTNTGNVALTGVTVTDPKCTSAITGPTGDTNSNSKLDLTETWVYTCTHTVTQAEMDAGGNLVNTVTADSNETGPDTDNLSIPIQQAPGLNVVKSSTTTVITAVGQVVPYTFTVTNTGNIPLTGVTVVDPKCTSAISGPTGDTNSNSKLDLTETWVYSCTHTVTLAELNAGGQLANTVTADSNETGPDTDPLNIPIQQNPALTLDKATTTANFDNVGDTISYNYTVTNSGNVSLIPPYAVSDNKITTPNTVTCQQTPNPLNPGDFFTCTATYTVTQADLTAGSVTNIASGTAKHGANTITSNTDTVTVPGVQTPTLALDKTTTAVDYDQVGDTIDYSYKLTNTGNVPLTPPYVVTDNKIVAPNQVICPQLPNPLEPGAFITCAATYLVTQADITAGSVTNVATATAKYGQTTVPSNQDTETVPAVQTPALTLDKDTTTANYDSAGDTIAYTYKVTNSGNVPLTPPYAVTDNKITAPNTVTCNQTPTPLMPGAFFECTATYTVTQADVDAGSVVNVAKASAKYGQATVESNEDTVTVPALQGPGLTLDKDTLTTNYDSVGDTIAYTYKVTNSGNVSLQPPYAVTDNKIVAPNTVNCNQFPAPLLPGAFFTCTATYVVTQADIEAGSVVNIATATAKNGQATVTSNPDTVSVPAVQTPHLALDKATTTANYDNVGDVINYTYKLTNDGNVNLNPPYSVSDNKATVTCPQTPAMLAPGAFITCNASYTITQADLDAGTVVNIATATAHRGQTPVESNEDTVTVPALQNPQLTLDKDTTTVNYDSVGDTIAYTYKVTNSGNVTLTPPYAVTDNKIGAPNTVTCNQTPNPLLPGDFFTCTATYTVTQADIEAGSVVNIASATAKHGQTTVTSNTDTETVPALQGPGLTLDKETTTPNYDNVGDVINYTYKLTNSGNVALNPPYSVSDNKATVTCPQTPASLAPGAFITCNASYTVTQADLDAGQVLNIATASAHRGQTPVPSNEDRVTVPAVQNPQLTLDKDTTTVNYDSVGDTIAYTYKVTNSGNVTLTPPYAVTDNKIGAPNTVTCNQTPNPLDPGDFFTCTATYTVTQADITFGSVTNIATATAKHGQDTVPSNQDTVTVPAIQTPALTLEKTTTTTSYDSVGDPIAYSYKVTNSGNVPVTPPYAVSDDKIVAPNAVLCPQTPNPLMPGAFITCTATYNVTQNDITALEVINTAQASAMYGSTPVLSNFDSVTVTMDQLPGLNVEKTSTTTLITAAGQPVDYRFAVTNNGNVPLTGVTVTDPKCDLPPTGPTGDADNDNKLDLNETWVYTCIHTVTQAEMDAGGNLVNTVTADSNETGPATDDLSIPIQQRPGLNVEKSSTTTLITAAGQPVVYTFDVTNTGNVSLTGITVIDPMCDAAPTGPTGDTNNDGKLGLVETWTFTCTHTVTQAELDAATGPNPKLHNVVTADSTETPPDTDDLDIPIQYNPGLNVEKSSTTALITAAGQQVPYQFTVTNTGNVTLTNVTVSDAKCDAAPVLQAGGDANNNGKLEVTETWVYTCTHTVTQAEMNAGGMLHNVVTADSTETPPDTDDLDIPTQQSPALSLDKDTTTVNYDSVGDTIAYTYKVTNSGNVSLTPPYTVSDNKITTPNTVTCQQTPNPLNPGDFFTCTATYTVTQADLDAGSVTNIASGSAMHGQTPVPTNTDTVTVPAVQTPLLEVTKTPNKTVVASGDLVTFTILVENKGTITLSLNSLIDSVYGDITTTGHNGITATTCDVTPPVTLAALTGTYTCTFTAAVTGNPNTTHNNTVTACDTTKNPDVCDDGSTTVQIIPDPAIEVLKTANPTQLYAPGGPVVFTIVVNNTGGGALTLSSLTDNVFGNITTTGHNGITATTCAVPQTISQGGTYTCQFTATVNGAAGTVHTDIVTGSGTGFNGDPVTDNDDAVVNIIAIPVVNTCPANQATHQWTDILGIGMGTTTGHKVQAKLVIPNSANVVELYGQLAGKSQGTAKHVRFQYPNSQYVEVKPVTSAAPRTWAVFWYGTELNPSANIRGRWFLNKSGTKGHIPRAFILYPTYNNPSQEYINVFEVINTGDSQVYWNIAEGWTPSRQLTIDIPAPMARATFNVELVVVDNDPDARPVVVTVQAGGVTQTQSPTAPNKGNQLNILSFTLANVPAGAGEIVITITSPQPNTNGLGALGGDSAAITGVTANYLCEDVQVIP